MKMRALIATACLAALATAGGPLPPALEGLRDKLSAPEREIRSEGERETRTLARADPEAVAALYDTLDLRGRCSLLRGLAASRNPSAAALAALHAGDPEPEVFHALLEGLILGGEEALFAPVPEGLPADRAAALEALRLRWRVESELTKLKSISGPTGSYVGQFEGVRALGRQVFPVLLDIVTDQQSPLPGEGSAGPYQPIHPGMARFDTQELRVMVANNLHQVVAPEDRVLIVRLVQAWRYYWEMDERETAFERGELAPALAFSLHDLGVPGPAEEYIDSLRHLLRRRDTQALRALWDLGYALIRVGRSEEGEACYRDVLENWEADSRALAAYNLACSFALRARREPERRADHVRYALYYLRMSADLNFVDWPWMEQDGDLDAIRSEPAYKELIDRLRSEYPGRKKGSVDKDLNDLLEQGARRQGESPR